MCFANSSNIIGGSNIDLISNVYSVLSDKLEYSVFIHHHEVKQHLILIIVNLLTMSYNCWCVCMLMIIKKTSQLQWIFAIHYWKLDRVNCNYVHR